MKIGIGTGSTIRPFIAALKKHIEANDDGNGNLGRDM